MLKPGLPPAVYIWMARAELSCLRAAIRPRCDSSASQRGSFFAGGLRTGLSRSESGFGALVGWRNGDDHLTVNALVEPPSRSAADLGQRRH